MHKTGAKESMATEGISAIRKKINTLYWNNRKDASRASWKLARPHPLQAQGVKL
jgi:hypothetical protein